VSTVQCLVSVVVVVVVVVVMMVVVVVVVVRVRDVTRCPRDIPGHAHRSPVLYRATPPEI
jgi:uncharacterized protein HemY